MHCLLLFLSSKVLRFCRWQREPCSLVLSVKLCSFKSRCTHSEMKLASPYTKVPSYSMRRPKNNFLMYDCFKKISSTLVCDQDPRHKKVKFSLLIQWYVRKISYKHLVGQRNFFLLRRSRRHLLGCVHWDHKTGKCYEAPFLKRWCMWTRVFLKCNSTGLGCPHSLTTRELVLFMHHILQ